MAFCWSALLFLLLLLGCIDIDLAPFVLNQFKQAQSGFILANELHVLYLATPLDQVNSVHLNWMLYYRQVCLFILFFSMSRTQHPKNGLA